MAGEKDYFTWDSQDLPTVNIYKRMHHDTQSIPLISRVVVLQVLF